VKTAHVHPVNDLIDHQLDDACPCGPTTEPEPRVDGSIGWIVVHHSLDGREHLEAAREGDGWFVTPVGAEIA
jgi:hypothetical protein